MRLHGAVVVVTGASSGFGELTARRLAKEGASVVLAARRLDRLEALGAELRAAGARASTVRCDVTEVDDLRSLRDAVRAEFGRCDVLINNAGVPGGGRFAALSIEQIERVMRVNALGVMLCTRLFLDMMLEQRHGHIVNVASLAGHFASPGAAVYSASKHAVRAFSEALYYELQPLGILVTSVNPIFARTEGFPMTNTPRAIQVKADTVARTIVDAVKRGRAPEVNVPRGLPVLQAFRILTPPLYRWGVRGVARRFASTPASDGAGPSG